MNFIPGSTRKSLVCFIVVCLNLACFVQTGASYTTIAPEDARGIRSDDGGAPFLLNFMAVKYLEPPYSPVHDRTVLEFDISGLSESVPLVTLDIAMENIDPGPPEGTLDIFTFDANGLVTSSDFFAGGPTPFTTIIVPDDTLYFSIDVTAAVHSALVQQDQFLGFRLSVGQSYPLSDRYNIGALAALPDPFLTVVPEPATIFLFALGTVMLRRKHC